MGNKTVNKEVQKRVEKSKYIEKVFDYAEQYGKLKGAKLVEWVHQNFNEDFNSVSYTTFSNPTYRKSLQDVVDAFTRAIQKNYRRQILQVVDVTFEEKYEVIDVIYKYYVKGGNKKYDTFFQYRSWYDVNTGKCAKGVHKQYVDESIVSLRYEKKTNFVYVPREQSYDQPSRIKTEPSYSTNRQSQATSERQNEQKSERDQKEKRDRRERQDRQRRQKYEKDERDRRERQRQHAESVRRQQQETAQRNRRYQEQQRQHRQNMRRQEQNWRNYQNQQRQIAEQRQRQAQQALINRRRY